MKTPALQIQGQDHFQKLGGFSSRLSILRVLIDRFERLQKHLKVIPLGYVDASDL